MKKHFQSVTISVVLLMLTALLATGCSQPPQSNTTPSTGSSTGTTEQYTIEADPLSQYIQSDISEIVSGSDSFGNKWSIPICVPKFLPFSDDAIACQKEIQNHYTPRVEEICSNSAQNCDPATASIDYKAYLNGTILSVIICEASDFDLNTYLVYNFDTTSGERLDTDTLMDKLQVTDYTDKITQAVKSHFETRLTTMSQPIDLDFYNQQLAATTSKENLDKAMPYVSEDGSVKVIVNIYGFAGATYYPTVMSLP